MIAPDDPRHGTNNGYDNLGCRCAPCREAKRVYQLDYAHRTGRRRSMQEYNASRTRTHGRASTYNAGCRCDECRTNASARRQRIRLARRSA